MAQPRVFSGGTGSPTTGWVSWARQSGGSSPDRTDDQPVRRKRDLAVAAAFTTEFGVNRAPMLAVAAQQASPRATRCASHLGLSTMYESQNSVTNVGEDRLRGCHASFRDGYSASTRERSDPYPTTRLPDRHLCLHCA